MSIGLTAKQPGGIGTHSYSCACNTCGLRLAFGQTNARAAHSLAFGAAPEDAFTGTTPAKGPHRIQSDIDQALAAGLTPGEALEYTVDAQQQRNAHGEAQLTGMAEKFHQLNINNLTSLLRNGHELKDLLSTWTDWATHQQQQLEEFRDAHHKMRQVTEGLKAILEGRKPVPVD